MTAEDPDTLHSGFTPLPPVEPGQKHITLADWTRAVKGTAGLPGTTDKPAVFQPKVEPVEEKVRSSLKSVPTGTARPPEEDDYPF